MILDFFSSFVDWKMTRINDKNDNLNDKDQSFDSMQALILNSYRKHYFLIIALDAKSDEDSKNMLGSVLAQLVRPQSVKNTPREPIWLPRSAIG